MTIETLSTPLSQDAELAIKNFNSLMPLSEPNRSNTAREFFGSEIAPILPTGTLLGIIGSVDIRQLRVNNVSIWHPDFSPVERDEYLIRLAEQLAEHHYDDQHPAVRLAAVGKLAEATTERLKLDKEFDGASTGARMLKQLQVAAMTEGDPYTKANGLHQLIRAVRTGIANADIEPSKRSNGLERRLPGLYDSIWYEVLDLWEMTSNGQHSFEQKSGLVELYRTIYFEPELKIRKLRFQHPFDLDKLRALAEHDERLLSYANGFLSFLISIEDKNLPIEKRDDRSVHVARRDEIAEIFPDVRVLPLRLYLE